MSKRKSIAVAIVLLLILLIGGMMAFFTDTDTATNVFELGKVDIGGGGTIAYILANKGMDVIDCGVPVLSMHAPYEVTSKFDVWCAYKGYKAFYK